MAFLTRYSNMLAGVHFRRPTTFVGRYSYVHERASCLIIVSLFVHFVTHTYKILYREERERWSFNRISSVKGMPNLGLFPLTEHGQCYFSTIVKHLVLCVCTFCNPVCVSCNLQITRFVDRRERENLEPFCFNRNPFYFQPLHYRISVL